MQKDKKDETKGSFMLLGIENKFEYKVHDAAEKAVIKFVGDGNWLQPNFESQFKVPKEWIDDCWGLVDKDRLKKKFAERIEDELVERTMVFFATAIGTDIKRVLNDTKRREAIRKIATEHLDEILNAGDKKQE